MIHIAFPSGSRSRARSCVLQTRQSQALATRAAGDPLVLGGLGVLLDAVRVAAPERVRGACAVVLPEHAWDLVAQALRAELAHGCPLLSAALRSSASSSAHSSVSKANAPLASSKANASASARSSASHSARMRSSCSARRISAMMIAAIMCSLRALTRERRDGVIGLVERAEHADTYRERRHGHVDVGFLVTFLDLYPHLVLLHVPHISLTSMEPSRFTV